MWCNIRSKMRSKMMSKMRSTMSSEMRSRMRSKMRSRIEIICLWVIYCFKTITMHINTAAIFTRPCVPRSWTLHPSKTFSHQL